MGQFSMTVLAVAGSNLSGNQQASLLCQKLLDCPGPVTEVWTLGRYFRFNFKFELT
jgi:hypothetical protein